MSNVAAQRDLRNRLRLPGAPRVLTTGRAVGLILELRPGFSRSGATKALAALRDDGDLARVSHNLYLNRCQPHPPSLAEAAAFVRRGAVVSLHTVLGDAGVLNNYTHDVWSIIPQAPGGSTSLRSVELDDGARFVFRGIPEARLRAAGEDLLAPTPYPRASVEAALCHWIYLWDSPRSDIGKPPGDLDLDCVDMEKVSRVAAAMGIEDAYDRWAGAVRTADEQGVDPGLGF